MTDPLGTSKEEIEEWCHNHSLDEIGRVSDHLKYYITKYFGFDKRAKEARTEKWIIKASKRLEGHIEPCCECGSFYPAADLVLRDEIFCEKCRKEAQDG